MRFLLDDGSVSHNPSEIRQPRKDPSGIRQPADGSIRQDFRSVSRSVSLETKGFFGSCLLDDTSLLYRRVVSSKGVVRGVRRDGAGVAGQIRQPGS